MLLATTGVPHAIASSSTFAQPLTTRRKNQDIRRTVKRWKRGMWLRAAKGHTLLYTEFIRQAL